MSVQSESWIVEVRDENGELDPKKEVSVRQAHPFLFSREEYSIDSLCWYASYGQGRNESIGPMTLEAALREFGVSIRRKYWR